MRTRGLPPLAKPEISRFPRKELPHMPGSWTTPGRAAARAIASVRVAFRAFEHVGTQVAQVFAAQWLAYVLPYRRFADTLASANARLRAGADRYSFTVVDFHLLLLAGLPGAPKVLNFDMSHEAILTYNSNCGKWRRGCLTENRSYRLSCCTYSTLTV